MRCGPHCRLLALAGLALGTSTAATAQVQNYLAVTNTTNGVMLFNPQDGSLVNTSFIPMTGPAWDMAIPKGAVQVNDEIWIPDQNTDTVYRFDLNGQYYGKISGNMNNIRGAALFNGTVYVSNDGAAGITPADSVIRYDLNGVYLGNFPVDTSPYDLFVHNGELLLSDSGGSPDIGRYAADGTPLGPFHDSAMSFAQQISRKANGNLLVAAFTSARIYELSPAGVELATSPTVSSARGAHELGNGNVLCAGANVYLWDTTANTVTQVAAGASHYVKPLTINTAAVGACCFPDGTCQTLGLGDCGTQGGVFRGDGVACASAQCPQAGACCANDGTCTSLRQDYCAMAGGTWAGAGTLCASVTCPTRLVTPAASASSSTAGSGIFFDLTATSAMTIPRIDYWPGTAAGNPVTVDVYTRAGTYVGFDQDPGAWTHQGPISTTSGGNTTASPPTVLSLPSAISIGPGETVGVYLVGTVGGYRYRSSTTANPVSDVNLSLESSLARTAPFAGTTSVRRFAGIVHYTLGGGPPACYANCDGSTQAPVLNVQDFSCFLTRYAAGESYANCDESTQAPVLNVQDFSCFLTKYAAGCP